MKYIIVATNKHNNKSYILSDDVEGFPTWVFNKNDAKVFSHFGDARKDANWVVMSALKYCWFKDYLIKIISY